MMMKNKITKYILIVGFLFIPLSILADNPPLTITAKNHLSIGRLNQTIVLTKAQLAPLGKFALSSIHVKDEAGREILCQPIDMDGDYFSDGILFQADFAPQQKRTFTIYKGKRILFKPEQYKAYGRFVRERFDDFAWENDRIAQRTYGKALQTWRGGSLTSSTIDVWAKETDKLVINEWYMTGHYHINSGEGADLYSSGSSRGVGADGLWANNKLWNAANFVHSNVWSQGPIRVSFVLKYDSFNVNGVTAKESRHITLDAGHNLNHYEVTYDLEKGADIIAGIGIQKTNRTAEEVRRGIKPVHPRQHIERHPGKVLHKDINKKHGWMTTEQPLSEGKLYAAIIVNPNNLEKITEDGQNELMLVRIPENNTLSYWAGYSWSESGQFKNYEDWKKHIQEVALSVENPIKITVEDAIK